MTPGKIVQELQLYAFTVDDSNEDNDALDRSNLRPDKFTILHLSRLA
jgi:hypothetical protein